MRGPDTNRSGPKKKCPELDSNQHEPKLTSPSSYDEANHKSTDNNNVRESPQGMVPKTVPRTRENAPNDAAEPPADLGEVVWTWPQLPPAVRSAILTLVRASAEKADAP